MDILQRTFRENPDLLSAIQWVEGDISDLFSLEEAMKGAEEVYHSAGLVSFIPSDSQLLMLRRLIAGIGI